MQKFSLKCLSLSYTLLLELPTKTLSFAGGAEDFDFVFDGGLHGFYYRAHELHDREFVGVILEHFFERNAVGFAQFGVHIELGYADRDGAADLVVGSVGVAVEANRAAER